MQAYSKKPLALIEIVQSRLLTLEDMIRPLWHDHHNGQTVFLIFFLCRLYCVFVLDFNAPACAAGQAFIVSLYDIRNRYKLTRLLYRISKIELYSIVLTILNKTDLIHQVLQRLLLCIRLLLRYALPQGIFRKSNCLQRINRTSETQNII